MARDLTVTSAHLSHTWRTPGSQGFVIAWESVSAGFGEIAISLNSENELVVDSECMSKEFCQEVFAKFVDSFKILPRKQSPDRTGKVVTVEGRKYTLTLVSD